MEIIRLRTLTRKSILGWGKYKELNVDTVLHAARGHLIWLYYHVQWINFDDDVLRALGITGKWRIEKPGTSPETHEKLRNNKIRYKYGDSVGNYIIGNNNKKRRYNELLKAEKDSIESKARLQARNHGHIH